MSDSAITTRQRLLDVATELFRSHSIAGTSLQMISDELGITKSAIYYHFRTREELLEAVLEPLIAKLRELVDEASTQRGARAQADAMLRGFVALAVANRTLIPVLTGDAAVGEVLRSRQDWAAIVARQMQLLAGAQSGMAGEVGAAIVMSGISSAVGLDYAGTDEQMLEHLISAGRRTLGLRGHDVK
ncbi:MULTISPECIES: TetR/AcrR family transcriptional regulator [Mycobacteriaceae]|uniref:TetR/AcrR family transcriptional regulator n=1 Tax=Mycolicibacterium parafortuitum TaxID=39692 RepID=A0ACC6MKG7_MYCPF|nr:MULTISPECIES: TetR family transcriptional regulator [Mycobacteriaceae]MDZ5087337.1 TetR/AcrR family transcriptional regulator [Mycolicibacterium parafortuitum]GFM19404.1 TetR family transcriptional regulator [Mycobacterium sp. PO1]GFM22958.1 TetR family transcriptional regulator [Mycobacterium sp. PO2]